MQEIISFRDPSGYVILSHEKVKRHVSENSASFLKELLDDKLIKKWIQAGNLTAVDHVFENEHGLTLEHEKVPFLSYPYEWAPEMLHAAGELTLYMNRQLSEKGWGFKDATPYNILFIGPDPIFVDWLSIEKREPFDPLWLPTAQFMRSFIYPLLAQTKLSVPLNSIFLSRRDGLESEELYQMSKGWTMFTPAFFFSVTLPTWLSKRKQQGSIYKPQLSNSPEKAQFILSMQLKRLENFLGRLKPVVEKKSKWGGYLITETSYTHDQFLSKETEVKALLNEHNPQKVLDIGCNAGHFTKIAAEHAKEVVAIDIDPVVIGRLWKHAKEKKLPILPLVVDIARPSPAIGWDYHEQLSFLDRAEGRFDFVMMLAVLHHLLVQERIPMKKIAEMAHRLTTKGLLIEFVGREDAMFKRIARGRDKLHLDVNLDTFEKTFEEYFTIRFKKRIHDAHRYLYYMERK